MSLVGSVRQLSNPGPSSGSIPIGDGFLQTAAALNATAQQVTDNVGNGSALYLATSSAQVIGYLEAIGLGSTSATKNFLARNSIGEYNITAFDNKDTLIASPLYIGESNGSIGNYAARLRSGGANIFHLEANSHGAFNTILNMGIGEASISQVSESLGTNGSVLFGVNSTTKGFRTPRMTTANFAAIASKAQGLEAFSTDDSGKLWYDGTRTVGYRYNGSNFQGYNGSSWSNLGALQYFTESYASSTQASSQFLATNAATNINAVLAAKGNGAVLAQTPDGTSAGGNSRGFWAVDWQKVRAAADQVASGSQSVIGGGYGNTASGDNSTVPGGYRNEATANSSVAEGRWSKAYIYGQKAKSSGNFPASSNAGEAQASEAVVRKVATLDAGHNTELFANGTTEKLIPNGNNRAWNVVVETVAVCTAVGGGTGTVGDTYTSIYNLAFKRVGGTSSIVGTEDLINSNADAGMAGALLVFSAGASQELKIEWQAPSTAILSDFKIVSNVRLTEVAF